MGRPARTFFTGSDSDLTTFPETIPAPMRCDDTKMAQRGAGDWGSCPGCRCANRATLYPAPLLLSSSSSSSSSSALYMPPPLLPLPFPSPPSCSLRRPRFGETHPGLCLLLLPGLRDLGKRGLRGLGEVRARRVHLQPDGRRLRPAAAPDGSRGRSVIGGGSSGGGACGGGYDSAGSSAGGRRATCRRLLKRAAETSHRSMHAHRRAAIALALH